MRNRYYRIIALLVSAVMIFTSAMIVNVYDTYCMGMGGGWSWPGRTSTEATSESENPSDPASSDESDTGGSETSSTEFVTKSVETIPTTTEETTTTAEPVYLPIQVGDYLIDTMIKPDVACPQGFILAYDVQNFSQQIQAFYSPGYQLFVYHGTKDGVPGYYIYDRLNATMVDFILIQSRGEDDIYALIRPSKLSNVPGIFVSETTVSVTNCFDAREVEASAFLVKDTRGDEVTLVYLTAVNGYLDYYVITEENGIPVLTAWNEYIDSLPEETTKTKAATTKEEETTKKTSAATTAATTEEVTTEYSDIGDLSPVSVFRRPLTWILICIGMFLLVLVTVLVVFRISRRQDEEEAELDSAFDEYDEPEFESSYSQSRGSDLKPFDVNFEDAFPEELSGKNTEPEAEEQEIPEANAGENAEETVAENIEK